MANVIGHASVDIRASDKFFASDVRKIVKNQLKDLKVEIKADVNMTAANKKIRDFRARNVKKVLMIKADIDTSKLDSKLEAIWNAYDGQELNVSINATSNIDEELDRARGNADIDSTITAHAETAGADAALDAAGRDRDSDIDVDVDGAEEAEAILDTVARNRRSTVHVNIDPRTRAAMMGMLHTISGTLPFQAIKNSITGIMSNFESLAVKTGVITTAVGGLSSAVLSLSGNLLVAGGDLSQVIGIASAGPAAIGMGALAVTTLALSWKGFGKAVSGTGKEAEKAMAALPKEAQVAAKALKGVGGEIRQVTQRRYWKELQTALQDTVGVIKGPLTKGLGDSGEALGKQTKGLFQAFTDFTKSGGLANTFSNLNQALRNSSGAVQGLTQGFLQFMDGGAKKMPVFTTWLSKVSTGFAHWAEEANRTGQIGVWIDNAVTRIEQLGSMTKDTIGIFKGLTKAARDAGLQGIDSWVTGLTRANNLISTPAFQTGMIDIFTGARNAMKSMGSGFSFIVSTFAKNTDKIRGFMEKSGDSIGQLFKNINSLITAGGFSEGFGALQAGIGDALVALQPGFASLGTALGGVMKIMGSVIREMAPGLNQLFGTIEGVVSGIADGIVSVMPTINEFVQTIMALAKSVLIPLAAALGGALSAFSAMPGPIKTLALAFLTLGLAMKFIAPRLTAAGRGLSGLGGNIRDGVRHMTNMSQAGNRMARTVGTTVVSGVRRSQTAFQTLGTAVRTSVLNPRGALQNTGAQLRGAFTGVASAARTAGQNVGSSFRSGLGRAGRGAGAALGMLGGWPGLLITGVIALGSAIIGNIQEQKAKIAAELAQFNDYKNQLQNSLDKKVDGGGRVTNETTQVATDQLNGSDEFKNVAGKFGISIDEVAQKSTSSIPQLKKFKDTFVEMDGTIADSSKRISAALNTAGGTSGNQHIIAAAEALTDLDKGMMDYAKDGDKAGFGQYLLDQKVITTEALKEMNISTDGWSKATKKDVENWTREIVKTGSALEQAQAGIKDTEAEAGKLQATIMDTAALQVDTNFRNMTTTISTAEEKLTSFKSNLSLRGQDFLGLQAADYQASVLADNVKTKFTELKTTLKEQLGGVDMKKLMSKRKNVQTGEDYLGFNFNSTNEKIRKGSQQLYATVSEQAGGMQETFVNAYDTALRQVGNTQEAQKIALDSTRAMRKTLVNEMSKSTGMDKGLIAKTLEISDKALKVGMSLDASEAITEALRVQRALQTITGKGWVATVTAETSKAQGQIRKVLGLKKNFTDDEFQAKISVLADNAGKTLDQFNAEFHASEDKKEYLVDVREQGADAVLAKLKGIKSEKKFEAAVNIVTKETGLDIDTVLSKINGLDGKQKKVFIEAVNSGNTKAIMASITDPVTKQVTFQGTNSVKDVVGPTPVAVPLALKPTQTLAQTMGLNGAVSAPAAPAAQSAKVTYDVPDLVLPTPAPITVEVKFNVPPTITVPTPPPAKVDVSFNVPPVPVIVFPPATVPVTYGLAPSFMSVPTPPPVTIQVVLGAMPSIPGIGDKTVYVKPNVDSALAGIQRVNTAAINPKTLSIGGDPSGALGAIARVNSAQVSNKTQTITTIHKSVGTAENRNGGMFMGGVRSFAKGGMDPRAVRALQGYRGGSENHRAQIAKGASKFRIWGEPETGGEAYIPLAASKRSRSMKILEQVAQHFGLSLSQQFNDGGFLGGASFGSGITSFASGGTTTKTKTKAQKKAEEGQKKANEKAKEAFQKFKELISTAKNAISNGMGEIKRIFGADKSPLQDALSDMGKDVRKFINTYKKDNKRKGQVYLAQKTLDMLSKQYSSSKVWSKKSLKYQTIDRNTSKAVTKKATNSTDVARVIAQDALKRQGNKKADFNTKYTLRDYELALGKVTAALEKQKTRLDNLKNSRDSLTTGVAGNLMGSYDLGSLVGERDEYGWRAAPTASSVKSYSAKIRKTMESLGKALTLMGKNGYNRALIADIANMDPDTALALATALNNDTTLRNAINGDYTAMFGAKGQYNVDAEGNNYVGGLAKTIGSSISSGLYSVGIRGQEALVKGLTAEEKALKIAGQKYSDEMNKIGKQAMDGLAKGITSKKMSVVSAVKDVVKAIPASSRKLLGIRSPSKVMADLGVFVPAGMAQGIDKGKPLVDASMARMVDTKNVDLTLPTRSQLGYANAGQSGIIDSKTSSSERPINVTVNPSQGLSEEQIGRITARELLYRLDSAAL